MCLKMNEVLVPSVTQDVCVYKVCVYISVVLILLHKCVFSLLPFICTL